MALLMAISMFDDEADARSDALLFNLHLQSNALFL